MIKNRRGESEEQQKLTRQFSVHLMPGVRYARCVAPKSKTRLPYTAEHDPHTNTATEGPREKHRRGGTSPALSKQPSGTLRYSVIKVTF